MTLTDLDQTACQMSVRLRDGELSAYSLALSSLDRIGALEPRIHAWVHLDRDQVLDQAREADSRRERGELLGRLHGLPIGVKDMYDTFDMPTEYGTPIHSGRRPAVDATIVARLRRAGAIVMGKTVLSEFAVMNPGLTRNPRDLTRTPGGSSSGSAAAVAARMVPLSIASQTNGSTIRPASFCGIVGYKPSLGLLPRTGALKQSTMLDQPGLMARNIADVALLFDALAGHDVDDEQSRCLPGPPLLEAAAAARRPPRLAYLHGPFWTRVDGEAQDAFNAFLGALNVKVDRLELPADFSTAADVHATIMDAGIAEAFDDDYSRSGSRMGKALQSIIQHGRSLTAIDFIAALSARERMRSVFARLSASYDAILTPATLGVAPHFEDGTGNPIMATIWTLIGAPSLTLPLLADASGLPLGVQLVGGILGDDGLISAAAWLEREAGRLQHANREPHAHPAT